MSAPLPLSPRLVRSRFNAAATTYANAAVAQREVGNRLLERFDLMRIAPQTVLDVGCGPGTHTAALRARFPNAMVVAIDLADSMMPFAAPAPTGLIAKLARKSREPGVVADMQKLPIKHASVDVLWSNFALQWANDLPALFAEWNRALKHEGVLMFTAPGPDTLRELTRAVTQTVPARTTSLHGYTDLHDIGDMLIHAGFADPVMDMEVITLEYKTTDVLWADMKAQGAMSAVASREKGLLPPRALKRLNDALDASRDANGMIRMSVEVIYGHAWKVPPKKTAEGHGIVRIESIKRGGRA
ncbi:MAG: methyltransferase domain-containing protein [Casimicrobium sp.]